MNCIAFANFVKALEPSAEIFCNADHVVVEVRGRVMDQTGRVRKLDFQLNDWVKVDQCCGKYPLCHLPEEELCNKKS